MFIYLILLFTVVPVVELAILIKFGSYIGTMNTISIVIITGVVGAYLAKMQGLYILRKIETDVNQGKMPADKLFDGVIILCSGLLLLTPGFITDFLGFLGLIPFTRSLLKDFLRNKAKDIISDGKVVTITSFRSK